MAVSLECGAELASVGGKKGVKDAESYFRGLSVLESSAAPFFLHVVTHKVL